MTLAGGNEINQVHAEVFNFRVWLVARMLGFGIWWWSSFRIASIHGNGWIHGADHIIRIAGDVFNCSYEVRVVVSGQQLFHIRGIGKPGNTMNVWTSMVLPLKLKPVVHCSQNTNVEGIDELVDPVSKKPVRDCWIVCNGSIPAGTAVLVIWENQFCQFRPLGVSSAVCEEDCGQSQSIYHGYKPAPLFEPVLSSPTQATGIVQHSVAEELSFPSNHVSQLFEGETGILWVLVDEYPASL